VAAAVVVVLMVKDLGGDDERIEGALGCEAEHALPTDATATNRQCRLAGWLAGRENGGVCESEQLASVHGD
jgi:hypothetical protein